jgi:hypothetical protein
MEFCELVKLSGSSEIVGICVTKPTNVICEVKRILWKLKTNGVKGILNCTSKNITELDCLVQGFIVQLELKFSRSHTCLMSAFNFPNNLSFFIYVIGKPKTSEIFSESHVIESPSRMNIFIQVHRENLLYDYFIVCKALFHKRCVHHIRPLCSVLT